MKKIFFISIAAIGILSCSKKNDDNPIAPINGSKIKTETYKGKVTTYTYDDYGRQVKQSYSDGGWIETSYSTGKVVQKEFSTGGVYDRTMTIQLNADGLRSRIEYSNKPGNYIEYKYNAQKQLTKVISKADQQLYVADYYYTAGNLDSSRNYMDGAWYLTNVYTYYLDKQNAQTASQVGISFWGAEWKNLLKSLTHNQSNGNITPETYSYDFDAQGRIIALNQTTPNGNSSVYYTYY